jgi:hypothetical protein
MKLVLMLSGKAGSGKTTVRTALQKAFETNAVRVFPVSFADGVRKVATEIFGWDGDKTLYKDAEDKIDLTRGRGLLIGVGMKMREINPSVWVDLLVRRIYEGPNGVYIVDDARFPNEITVLKRIFGASCVSFRLTREGITTFKDETEDALDHEVGLFDFTTHNNTTPDDAAVRLTQFLEARYAPDNKEN